MVATPSSRSPSICGTSPSPFLAITRSVCSSTARSGSVCRWSSRSSASGRWSRTPVSTRDRHRELTPSGAAGQPPGPARHERADIDEAALRAARAADLVLAAARDVGSARWTRYFEPLPDRLRDDAIRDLRATALRIRAAFGPKDSIRDVAPAAVTEPLLDSVDRLLKALA